VVLGVPQCHYIWLISLSAAASAAEKPCEVQFSSPEKAIDKRVMELTFTLNELESLETLFITIQTTDKLIESHKVNTNGV
jgi:hypothetical protein